MRWSDALFNRSDVHSVWIGEVEEGSALALSVTGCLISAPPPERIHELSADTPEELKGRGGVDVVWASLATITDSRLFIAV